MASNKIVYKNAVILFNKYPLVFFTSYTTFIPIIRAYAAFDAAQRVVITVIERNVPEDFCIKISSINDNKKVCIVFGNKFVDMSTMEFCIIGIC